MTIQVEETDQGFIIEWDPDDPVESIFNDWTEEDFLTVIMNAAQKVIDEHEIAQKCSGFNSFEQEFMVK
ncbi:MAG: hypothetical protein ACO236_04320 [Candidatus Nanopelagicaceae bacterium]